MQFRAKSDANGEFRRQWRLQYCGSCKTIGREYGQRARLLLNHDAVFLCELLTALGRHDLEEWAPAYKSWNCGKLPSDAEIPPILKYIAAATMLLSEYKVRDHELDSKRRIWTWLHRFLSRRFGKARSQLATFGFPVHECDRILNRQQEIEMRREPLNVSCGPTAEATSLVFRHGAAVAGLNDGQAEALAAIGRDFGRLIYLLDAWEDFENDGRTGAFNALRTSGLDRSWASKRLRAYVIELASALDRVGAPRELGLRLCANVESRLGPFRVVRACRHSANAGVRARWRDALARTRQLKTPGWTFAAVLGAAFLFPVHARSVRTSSECLSLGLNAMAVGGLIAAVGVGGGEKKGTLRSAYNSCCGGWLGELDCDCCCEGCCDGCCGACCSCDSCDCG